VAVFGPDLAAALRDLRAAHADQPGRIRLAIALALGLWTMAAAVMIGLWRMLDVESLV
jgi:hypothetical protein